MLLCSGYGTKTALEVEEETLVLGNSEGVGYCTSSWLVVDMVLELLDCGADDELLSIGYGTKPPLEVEMGRLVLGCVIDDVLLNIGYGTKPALELEIGRLVLGCIDADDVLAVEELMSGYGTRPALDDAEEVLIIDDEAVDEVGTRGGRPLLVDGVRIG